MILTFFDTLQVTVSDSDWDFMCKNRFFTDNPDFEHIQAEFVSGTGITRNKPHLWATASERFAEYVSELREIRTLDINGMARNLLTEEEKYHDIPEESEN